MSAQAAPRARRGGGAALAAAVLLGLAGCSSWNMTPRCDETGPGVMKLIATRAGERPDYDRIGAIMAMSDFQERSAGYNQRVCQARVTAFGETVELVYHARQSEGVQGWFEVELVNGDDPAVSNLLARIRAAYAG